MEIYEYLMISCPYNPISICYGLKSSRAWPSIMSSAPRSWADWEAG